MSITVVIFTPKDDENIKDCIKSAQLLTQNIILVFPTSTFVETVRESGIKQVKTDWVLILDADERLTEELAKEIKEILRFAQDDRVGYYKIPRKNIFAGVKWLKHGGWWPDYQIRLINRKYFIGWPKRIHSTPQIKGNYGYLKNPLIHYFHGDLNKMVEKTIVFEDIESDLLYKAGKTANTPIFFRKYFAELYRRMFKGLGFLDGTIGIIESIYQAFSKTITYLFLYEKNRSL
ncbi:hypothetical protein COY88_00185 [Candidatus Roizmanbacteria bacterium CG_4_10_14_0_8_um_filter_35_28]|uniref:Glycosyltransferase 2-like domain-containing protein n=5 Tax=Candidatus Roizmaniibacteriota TaxID=1752723 RepID=A0A2M8F2S8_9BACT|nr:MAG: hypothetical protein COY88_00185 [Candidatus Roizmanbacteria bacterium CG_4_10_14_0_8_um_filter_35_28]PJC33578.1 MAG: hypothetical protein CO048_02890 [Candidatus Roizmanbacteria bacterium CG_4_9_14_0_2_um_filter_35_15]PJC82586.1 MAG: hypothetical protein CO006_02950 [Candidatus Roizmanbacteria bacterium CG_4_8_14_3_um_filter_35_14]